MKYKYKSDILQHLLIPKSIETREHILGACSVSDTLTTEFTLMTRLGEPRIRDGKRSTERSDGAK